MAKTYREAMRINKRNRRAQEATDCKKGEKLAEKCLKVFREKYQVEFDLYGHSYLTLQACHRVMRDKLKRHGYDISTYGGYWYEHITIIELPKPQNHK